MNKTEFIHLIQHPETLKNGQVAALKQVLGDFPYFTNAQVLLAKALHNEQHYEYDKFLKQTALTVPDREVLYHYIHQLDKPWVRNVEIPLAVEINTNTPTLVEENTSTETQEEQPVSLSTQNIEPLTTELVENIVEEIEQPLYQPQQEIISSIDDVNDAEVLQSVDEIEADLAIEALLNEKQITVETTAPPAEIEQTEPVDETDLKNPVTENTEEHSFMEWLALKAKLPTAKPTEEEKPAVKVLIEKHEPIEEEKVAEIPEKTEVVATENIAPQSNASLPEVTKEDIEKAVAKSNVNDFHGILDKFIKENPSISRPKAEFFNPMNMAKQSVEEDEELVTETLANLYYKQGNLKKAIRAYEKLCLKYPSKITYFANLIQKIKTELKD